MNFVSVIIPTYNRASLVLEAIESVHQQTHTDFELIVVDDGSTDETVSHIQRLFPSVRIIKQSNQGVSAARNRGIQAATHDWLAFLDADDLWTPTKLEQQVAQTLNQQALVSYTNEIWFRNGRRVNPKKKHQKYSGEIFEYCLPLCIMSASSILIHRSVFNNVGIFDPELPACEDYDLWLRIGAQYQILYLDDTFIIKRNGVDELHLSQKYWGMDRFRIQSLEKILQEVPLTEAQRGQVLSALQTKRSIFQKGAQKRRNTSSMHYI